MSSPSPIPMSSQQSATANQEGHSFPLPSFRSILTRLSGLSRHALSNRRPWAEIVDRTAFSRPVSFSDAASRVRKNAAYFRVNYLIVLAAVLAYSLLSHPFTLLTLVGLAAAWIFLYSHRQSDQPLVILGRSYSDTQVLFGLGLVTLIAILVTSVLSLLITALMVGAGIVSAHGAFRDPEDLFLDESQPLGSGFASMFSGAATSAGASMMSRV
ncbi:PRA1 family protein B2-like [Argentina anserina]|uniref:PRA1 family protein B2-like n=1 Tax=Argentina anserina TaxID=57926 RepID=UPI002176815F|nr:PRA1 family protein B2-like [Potentilla anserina]